MSGERDVVYYPEELALLGRVFDEVIATLPAARRTPGKRTEIARTILRHAAAGERDPMQLCLAALADLTDNEAA